MVKDILEWLELLTKEEQTQLLKFLNSSFFNSTKEITKLYEVLRKVVNTGSSYADWNEKLLCQKLYASSNGVNLQDSQDDAFGSLSSNIQTIPKNLVKLRKHLAKLKELIQQFIAHQELKTNESIRQQALITALFRRSNKDIFEQACNDYVKLLPANHLGADQYGQLAWLFRERHSYPTAERFMPNLKNFFQANDYHNRHFLALKLRHICESLSRQNFFQEVQNLEYDDEICQWAQHYYESDLLIRAYLDIRLLLKDGFEEQRFLALQEAVITHKACFSTKDLEAIIKFVVYILFNTQSTINSGKDDLLKSIVEWFKLEFSVSPKIGTTFLINQEISDEVFLNVSIAAALSHDFTFLDHFINSYSPCIPVSRCKDAVLIARAYGFLHSHQYAEAFNLIRNHYDRLVREDFRYAVRVRMIRIRYHLVQFLRTGEFDSEFKNDKVAFFKFLKDQANVSENRKLAYRNFLSTLQEIFQLSEPDKNTKTNRTALIEKIKKIPPVIGGAWLIHIVENDLKNARP